MKFSLVLVSLLVLSSGSDDLKDVLRSPKATLNLYSTFKSNRGLTFGASSEDRMRFSLFRKNAQFVVNANGDNSGLATFSLNKFSTMTEGEKAGFLGVNSTDPAALLAAEEPLLADSLPDKVLWNAEGAVTPVKDQGDCGSSWAFSATGAIEGRYAVAGGKLRNLAEQEYLDCAYWWNLGCSGGTPMKCYKYSSEEGGRLSRTSKYPYRATDRFCKSNEGSRNGLISWRIHEGVRIPKKESSNLAALAIGPISMIFEATNLFRQYSSGIFQDNSCRNAIPNHGVVGVGYTADYILAKNAWGADWGDAGFVKFARGFANCGLFTGSSFPRLISTNHHDNLPEDTPTDYLTGDEDEPTEEPTVEPTQPAVPTPAPTPVPDPQPGCFDKATNCERDSLCAHPSLAETWCPAHCGYCEATPTEASPNPEPSPTPMEICYDKATNCERDNMCENAALAENWCRKHCNYCQG